MADPFTCIGRRFEEFFIEHFPGFEPHTKDGDRIPDFYNPKFNFWVEVKCGNQEWGVRLKEEQRDSFRQLGEPIIYFIGLHNFEDALQRLRGKTDAQRLRLLRRKMDILETHLVSSEIVDRVIEKETRSNGKETIRYCMMKKHILTDIMTDRHFTRQGVVQPSAEAFYGHDRSDFEFYDFSEQRTRNAARAKLASVILAKEHENVADYLRRRRILAA